MNFGDLEAEVVAVPAGAVVIIRMPQIERDDDEWLALAHACSDLGTKLDRQVLLLEGDVEVSALAEAEMEREGWVRAPLARSVTELRVNFPLTCAECGTWHLAEMSECANCHSGRLVFSSADGLYACPGAHATPVWVEGAAGDYCADCLVTIGAHHGDTGSVD